MIFSRYSVVFIIFLAVLSGCAPKKPVLYPNAHLKQVGIEVSQVEIDECMKLAEESGAKEGKGKKIAKDTAGAAVIGGASGAAWGAVWGDAGKSAKGGAAVGAASALAHGAVRSREPGVIFRGFVERCLREKGFEVIGWR